MTDLSIIVPARNERAAIVATVEAVLAAVAESRHSRARIEIIVVDNGSTDGTAEQLAALRAHQSVRVVREPSPGAARARNAGVAASAGRLLLFMDADTRVPSSIVSRVFELADQRGFRCGMFGIEASDPTFRARLWWTFWNLVRHLPLAHAKALPALMFCTREAFDGFGGFDEAVAIGEEWPILAGQYRLDRRRLVYDRATVALTSSRRMELRRFGYSRLFVKYVLAILIPSFRVRYADDIREPAGGT